LETLESSKEIVVVEGAEEWEDDDKQPTITEGEIFKIPGSVVSFVERLDDELTRSLQHIDPHTSEYIDRLTDEGSLYASLVRALVYVENLKNTEALNVPQESVNRVIMRRLEHVYFKVRHLPMTTYVPTNVRSPPKLSQSSRTTPGKPSPPALTPRSLPALPPTTPLLSSRLSAHTYSSSPKASSVPGLCCARSTSWLCMTSTTGLAI
jgi:hypothetical protein